MSKYQKAFVPFLVLAFVTTTFLYMRQLDSESSSTIPRKLIHYQLPSFWRLSP